MVTKEYIKSHPFCIENKALNLFGETNNVEHAGYILPDGTMLNFSYDGYLRTEDHRAIGQFFKNAQGYQAVLAFMKRGNVRVNCNRGHYGFEFYRLLTPKQEAIIKQAEHIAMYNGYDFFVDQNK